MLDVHPAHHAANTWRDFFIHIATIVIGLLIAVGLEQTVEAIHHHHQREQLDRDLREETVSNLKNIRQDLQIQRFERWYDDAAAAVSTSGSDPIHVTLTPLPCIPGATADSSSRLVIPFEGVWITARANGLATLLPADQARTYYRRSVLFGRLQIAVDQAYEQCPRLNAFERRLARRSKDGSSYSWTLTPAQAEEFAALASQETSVLKALCFRLRYLGAFEEDLLDGGHRVNGAPLDSTLTEEFLDPEDRPQPR